MISKILNPFSKLPLGYYRLLLAGWVVLPSAVVLKLYALGKFDEDSGMSLIWFLILVILYYPFTWLFVWVWQGFKNSGTHEGKYENELVSLRKQLVQKDLAQGFEKAKIERGESESPERSTLSKMKDIYSQIWGNAVDSDIDEIINRLTDPGTGKLLSNPIIFSKMTEAQQKVHLSKTKIGTLEGDLREEIWGETTTRNTVRTLEIYRALEEFVHDYLRSFEPDTRFLTHNTATDANVKRVVPGIFELLTVETQTIPIALSFINYKQMRQDGVFSSEPFYILDSIKLSRPPSAFERIAKQKIAEQQLLNAGF